MLDPQYNITMRNYIAIVKVYIEQTELRGEDEDFAAFEHFYITRFGVDTFHKLIKLVEKHYKYERVNLEHFEWY